MFSMCIDPQKGPSFYPSEYYASVSHILPKKLLCYMNAAWKIMLIGCFINTRTDLNFRDQVWNRPTTKCWVKEFFLSHKHHASNFNRNVKSISNTLVSHLVSGHAIPKPASMKGWDKEVHSEKYMLLEI